MNNNRAFLVDVRLKGIFRKRVHSIVISDGYNRIELDPSEYFTIDTEKPIEIPLIKHNSHSVDI